jgi:hypothetical protein
MRRTRSHWTASALSPPAPRSQVQDALASLLGTLGCLQAVSSVQSVFLSPEVAVRARRRSRRVRRGLTAGDPRRKLWT